MTHRFVLAALGAGLALCACAAPPRSEGGAGSPAACAFVPAQITRVSVQNADPRRCSYTLTIDTAAARLVCGRHGALEAQRAKVEQYLSYFYHLGGAGDSAAAALPPPDSAGQHLEYTIEAEDINGKKHTLTIFNIPCPPYADLLRRPAATDPHHCWVKCDSLPAYAGRWIDYDILTPPCHYFNTK